MKKLTCEICQGTDFMKQDGAFVCQSCGTKYSVEEVKKMMSADDNYVPGNVTVVNAAQLENLLNLANSSFVSKNFAQTEEFCNQVIAIDSRNHKAWKLKGEAINYQINSDNQRILEVNNCIMTSYRVLDDEEKIKLRDDILKSLRECLEGEIIFRLGQFENQRPTDGLLEKVKSSFIECASMMIDAYGEMGYSADETEKYKDHIKTLFVTEANKTCVRTWKHTVYYNYYRDGWTEEYRPNNEIFRTYINEGDNLIDLLNFCTDYFTEDIPVTLRAAIYENMIFYHRKLSEARSYKRMVSTTTNGYGAVTDRREYWEDDLCLSDSAIKSRKAIIETYREKIEDEFRQDNIGKSFEELIKLGREHLVDGEPLYAFYRYYEAVNRNPDSVVAHLGKAVANTGQFGMQQDTVEEILAAKKLTINPDDKEYIDFLINYKCGYDAYTLLMVAASKYSFAATKYLVDLGADINAAARDNTTALWQVAHKNIDKEKLDEGRQIARLLIDKGANIKVSSINGISLYNMNTDSEIQVMIRNLDPMAVQGSARASNSGGCYVATAVYGSYDCPQVWTLRRFRDYTLAETWYGRAFIRTYYAISPTLVKWFGHTEWFKNMWKGTLDRMVANLNATGVENTPYEDKKW